MSVVKLSNTFITGTDTGVGKTYVTVKLMQALIAQGLRVIGMKPIASGLMQIEGEWQNEDVYQLMQASNVQVPSSLVNPYCFEPAIAPHIAAEQQGLNIDIQTIVQAYRQLKSMADVVLVEGAGGICVPLNANHTIADLIVALELPTLLVVGLKLGCINHALLTQAYIQQRQLPFAGWVANHVDENMAVADENLATLCAHLKPPLKTFPFRVSIS